MGVRQAVRAPLLLAVLLFAGCTTSRPISHRVIVDFSETNEIRVAAITEITQEPTSRAMVSRIASTRDAIAGNRDEWSIRFAAARPGSDRTVIDRVGGQIVRAEKVALVDADGLGRFFADMPATVSVTNADGLNELLILPASSNRATRQERERVMAIIRSWSRDSAAYFRALGNLYRFMDENPLRSRITWELLVGDRSQLSAVPEEQALLEAVWEAGDRILDRVASAGDVRTIDEEFDLVFNPFPADVIVELPREPVIDEGFEKEPGHRYLIRQTRLIDALEALEGKWISPDPLAITLRKEDPDPRKLAALPRRWSHVITAAEIERAVIERLTPPATFRLRWR